MKDYDPLSTKSVSKYQSNKNKSKKLAEYVFNMTY